MLYFLFFKKFENESAPFLLTEAIKSYQKYFGKSDFVISFPGYMSKTKKTITDFIGKMNFTMNTFFTMGMNGMNKVPKSSTTIQEEHNKQSGNLSFKNLNIGKDHSKMIFFIKKKESPCNKKSGQTTVKNDSDFNIDCAIVNAVLIGSSNQSYSTYFGTHKKADKGEADLLIIDGDSIKENEIEKDTFMRNFYSSILAEEPRNGKDSQYSKNIVLSKEMCSSNNKLLNTMLQNCIQKKEKIESKIHSF